MTIFTTPILSPVLGILCKFFMWLSGWKVTANKPEQDKYILIGAPHTSNWDVLLVISTAFVLGLKVHWLGKHTLFKKPFGWVIRWLGGIPVIRTHNNNTVEQIAEKITRSDEMVLVVAPEGTRLKVDAWKTGFYRIAEAAQIPIGMGFVDFTRKQSGIGPFLMPTGDLEVDVKVLSEFYKDIEGKYPDQVSLPKFKS